MQRTRLYRFMKEHDISVGSLVNTTKNQISVRQVYYLRSGNSPTLQTAALISRACSSIVHRDVAIEELFTLQAAVARRRRRRAARVPVRRRA
jgi:hypothetical protein